MAATTMITFYSVDRSVRWTTVESFSRKLGPFLHQLTTGVVYKLTDNTGKVRLINDFSTPTVLKSYEQSFTLTNTPLETIITFSHTIIHHTFEANCNQKCFSICTNTFLSTFVELQGTLYNAIPPIF